MVRTEKGRDHYEEVERYQREGDGEPPAEDDALVPHVKTLATRKDGPRVTGLGDGGQHERAVVSAAHELVLDCQTTSGTDVLRPLLVEFSFQVESALLVGDVTGSDEEGERDPQHEGVPGEETAVVEEDTSPANHGGYDAQSGSDGRDNQLLPIPNSDHIRPVPD